MASAAFGQPGNRQIIAVRDTYAFEIPAEEENNRIRIGKALTEPNAHHYRPEIGIQPVIQFGEPSLLGIDNIGGKGNIPFVPAFVECPPEINLPAHLGTVADIQPALSHETHIRPGYMQSRKTRIKMLAVKQSPHPHIGIMPAERGIGKILLGGTALHQSQIRVVLVREGKGLPVDITVRIPALNRQGEEEFPRKPCLEGIHEGGRDFPVSAAALEIGVHVGADSAMQGFYILVVRNRGQRKAPADVGPLVPVPQGNPPAAGSSREGRIKVQRIGKQLGKMQVLRRKARSPQSHDRQDEIFFGRTKKTHNLRIVLNPAFPQRGMHTHKNAKIGKDTTLFFSHKIEPFPKRPGKMPVPACRGGALPLRVLAGSVPKRIAGFPLFFRQEIRLGFLAHFTIFARFAFRVKPHYINLKPDFRMQKIFVALLASVLMAVPAVSFAQINDDGINQATGQSANAISTAVPFLSLSPDARSSGMGDVGVATTADLYSQHYNAAKYPFMESDYGFSLTYSPWLINLVPDMSLAYLTGMYKFKDDRSAIAASLLYFSMGDVVFTDEQGGSPQNFRPNEFAIDVSYSRKLIDVLSIAVTGRFIYSNLTLGQYVGGLDTKAGLAGAADIGLYYNQDFDLGRDFKGGTLMAGLSITNIGNKMSYTSDFSEDADRNFLPAMLRLGVGFDWHIDDYNSVGFYGEVSKLLVPTPPLLQGDSIVAGRDNQVNVMQGIFQSFGDAPGGFKEEMQEFMWSLAAEYWWREIVAVRAGYFHESKFKGARQYFSLGVGVQYKMIGLDFSYLIPTSQISGSNPLKNTLRVGIKFNFNRKANE